MRILNMALLDAVVEGEAERFCTAIFGVVTPGERAEVVLASGGHPSPIVRHADGRTVTMPIGGSLLGIFPDADVRSVRVQLGPGDTLLLLTDGVLEARRKGQFFDLDGVEWVLANEVGSARAVANGIEKDVLAFTGGSLTDDMAAVVLRVPDA